jgi:glycosyltransferase involved in cell wall biosynthesis
LKIYKHSHFLPDEFGNGGNKRTAQINGILKNAGLNFTEADLGFEAITKNKASAYLRGLRYTKMLTKDNKSNYSTGRYIKIFETFIRQNKPDLFIWESTVGYNLLLAKALHHHKVPAIALPHNVESLVTGSKSVFTHKKSPDWLSEELKYLNYCGKTFAISREENWLLSNFGLDSSYLPYYPTHNVKDFLLGIREKKTGLDSKKNELKEVLLLGTFYNKPTADGYIELINNIKQHPNVKLHIAGYGSDLLKSMFAEEHIEIWGDVSAEVLTELIVKCDYAIIHQQPSSGSLTRIPEMLIAGLPILLNAHAARSTYDFKGLKVYNSYDELSEMLQSDAIKMPPVLERPAEEDYFAAYVKKAIA